MRGAVKAKGATRPDGAQPGPSRRTRTQAAEDVRARLLAAARTVFLREGFHGATLDAVAEQAGFTKGAVYSRFEGKADLFLALLDEHVEARGRLRAAQRLASGTPRELSEHAMRAWREQTRREGDWGLLILEFWCHAARDSRLRAAFAARQRRLRDKLAELVAEQVGESERFSAPEIALAMLALGNGMTLELLVDPDVDPTLDQRLAGALAEGMTS
jgi:AcrR family transcriptional regulator